MAKRTYKWTWQARIEPATLEALRKLAGNLGFIVDAPGHYQNTASAPALLDALAAAYERDSGAVIDALREIGVVNRVE